MKKKAKININKKQIIIFAGIAVVVLVIIVIFFNRGANFGNKDITQASFEYLNYSVVNESFLKENCPVINIARCDTIGEEFGVNCYTREVDLFFNVDGISYKDVTCDATDGVKTLGPYALEKRDSSIYLPVKVDIRKFNSLDVCCNSSENSEEVCFNDIAINAVC